MRALERNKQCVWFANYVGKTELIDADGNYTGEYAPSYTDPLELRANVSVPTGTSTVEQFGESVVYDAVLVLADLPEGLREESVFWIGTDSPVEVTDIPFNYIVKRIAPSINSVRVAVKKVDVDGH